MLAVIIATSNYTAAITIDYKLYIDVATCELVVMLS